MTVLQSYCNNLKDVYDKWQEEKENAALGCVFSVYGKSVREGYRKNR